MRRYLLLFSIIFSSIFSNGQNFDYKNSKFSQNVTLNTILTTGAVDVITVEHPQFTFMCGNSSWGNDLKIKSLHNLVKFDINYNDNSKVSQNYIYVIPYTLKGFSDPNNCTTFTTIFDTLTVSYNRDSLKAFQDKFAKKYSGFHKFSITIDKVYQRDFTTGVLNITPMTLASATAKGLNCRVECEIWYQYYDKKYYSISPPMPAMTILKDVSKINTHRQLGISWQCPSPLNYIVKPSMMEFEWLYVDNYKCNWNGTNVDSIDYNLLKFDFKNNSTRIITKDSFFSIPLVYDKGFIVYRTRMIRPDSTNYLLPIYGDWSIAENGFINTIGAEHRHKIEKGFMNDSLNWQYQLSFAEDGKFKHIVSYHDGLLYNKQTTTKVNSDPDNIIAAKAILDYEGRPAIQLMPVPVVSPKIDYVRNLANSSATGLIYKARDFDSIQPSTSFCSPPVLDSLSTNSFAYQYYSPLNPNQTGFHKYIPNANGYPFMHTQMSPESDKKIFAIGGFGKELQLSNGHATKYRYSSGNQISMNQMFGVEAGYESFYNTQYVQDPHGQVSLSVTDFQGKTVATSMVGLGPDSVTYPIDKMALPAQVGIPQELITSTNQIYSGNNIELHRPFDNDVSGNNPVNYTVSMAPFPTGCPNKFLTVKSKYHYDILDDCYNVVDSSSGLLGNNSVITNGTPIVSTATGNPFLLVATYNANKVLSINSDDIAAVVDTFLKMPNTCYLTENFFIKQAIEEKTFPCKGVDKTPCGQSKRQMMDELYPNQKYGKFGKLSTGAFLQTALNLNSIFESNCRENLTNVGPNPICTYKYQDSCLTLPASVVYNGRTYTNLKALPQDTFIMIFNDAIAEALLPLHPEYCKLLQCFFLEDKFTDSLRMINTVAQGQGITMFHLQDIVNKDPLITKGVLMDSLLKFNGSNARLDSFALRAAYCGSTNVNTYQQSFANYYQSILTSTLPFQLMPMEPQVLEFYYQSLLQVYISNRESIKARMLYLANTNGCGPCKLKRLTLIPSAVFPDIPPMFGGGVNSQGDSLTDLMNFVGNDTNATGGNNGLSVPSWLSSTMTSGTLTQGAIDSMNAYGQTQDSLMCIAKVEAAIHAFKNCTNNAVLLASIKTGFINAFCIGNQDWTPTNVKAILLAAGATLNDICNPYIISYNEMPQIDLGTTDLACKNASFYADAKIFFNKPIIHNTFLNGISTPFTLSITNVFENEIYTALALTSPSVNVITTYNAANNGYAMVITDASNVANKINLWFTNTSTNTSLLPLTTYINFTVDDVACMLKNQLSVLPSHINFFSLDIRITATTSSGTLPIALISYNNKIKTLQYNNQEAAKELNGYATCKEIKAVYQEIKTDFDSYGLYYKHPNFYRCISNFLNYKSGNIYSDDDVAQFMSSCAYSDSITQKSIIASWRLVFPNTLAADNALNSITTQLGYVPDYTRLQIGTTEEIWVNYLEIDNDSSYLLINGIISGLGATISNYNYRNINDSLAQVFIPATSAFNTTLASGFYPANTDLVFSTGTPIGVYNNSGTLVTAYTRYFIKITNSILSKYQLSRYVDSLQKYVFANEGSGFVWSNFASFQNDDYYLNEKQEWLGHNYNTLLVNKDSLLARVIADSLQLQMPSITNKNVAYGTAAYENDYRNLNINDVNTYTVSVGYRMLAEFFKNISFKLQSVAGYPAVGGFSIIEDSMVIPNTFNTVINNSFKVFRCGGDRNRYLIRYFDNTNLQLYTTYYEIPVSLTMLPSALFKPALNKILIGPADGITFEFGFMAQGTGNVKIPVRGFANYTIGQTLQLENSLLNSTVFNNVNYWDTTNCESQLMAQSIEEGKFQYAIYIDSIRKKLINDFSVFLKTNITESFKITTQDLKYNFTLYYYDRADNLVRTVPPGGTKRITYSAANMTLVNNARDAKIINAATLPTHQKISNYFYNSFNQVHRQSTPDGGTTNFAYDALGRMIFSQNAKQAQNGQVSYTLYDPQGRIIEVGQIAAVFFTDVMITNSIKQDYADIYGYIMGKSRSQVVATCYDKECFPLGSQVGMSYQTNLRKRVSVSKYFSGVSAGKRADSLSNYNFATYYSYDVVGNVTTLTHDFRELLSGKQRFKRIDYDFDLMSGKVNMVSYNRGFADQFYQKYAYDGDNKITEAQTSKDGIYWDKDASYQYYLHGPLARIALGDRNIQGIDYAYTIQGWLKSINTDVLDSTADMGKDGLPSSVFLKDVFALTLDYFTKDYASIGGAAANINHIGNPIKSLYNGNIARQNIALQPFDALSKDYKYDPLNRLKKTNYNVIAPVGGGYGLTATGEFKEKFSYDEDGNIDSLVRRGNKVAGVIKVMDSMVYYYNTNATNTMATAQHSTTKNQLKNVFEFANHAATYTNDIATYPTVPPTAATIVADRFAYDAIGNLVQDQMNGINKIDWNLYGKISKIDLPNSATDLFTYDATGNRISKLHSFFINVAKDTLHSNTDVYVRDASGNILAIIKKENDYVIKSGPTKFPVAEYVDKGFVLYSSLYDDIKIGFLQEPDFAANLVAAARQNSAVFNNTVGNKRASSFYKIAPNLLLQTLLMRPATLQPMLANNNAIVQNAIRQMDTRSLIMESFVPEGNDTDSIRLKRALGAMYRANVQSLPALGMQLGVDLSPDSSTMISELVSTYFQRRQEFVTVLNELLSANNAMFQDPAFKDNLIQFLMENADYYNIDVNGDNYSTHRLISTALCEYLDTDATLFNNVMVDMDANDALYRNALFSIVDSPSLMQYSYRMAPDSFMDAVRNSIGLGAISNAIALMPNMDNARLRGILLNKYDLVDYVSLNTTTTTLIKEQIFLAEHHLYGSARLGIKKYLPNHYSYFWQLGKPPMNADSATINQNCAWYSHAINDFVTKFTPNYIGQASIDKNSWISNRIIGLKHYELCNHLGNVQATVLDKYTPRTKLAADPAYNIWYANLSSATDYYPFGSPMPGRNVSDELAQNIYITQPFTSLKYTNLYTIATLAGNFAGYNSTITTSGTSQVATATTIGAYGASVTLNSLTPNKHYLVYIKTNKTSSYGYRYISPSAGVINVLNASTTATPNIFLIDFIADGSTELIHVLHNSTAAGSSFSIDSFGVMEENGTNTLLAMMINTNNENRYRFGSGKQEMDNEIAGFGNMNTALFWEYDTRLGRRWNMDPEAEIPQSPYAVFNNNPILFNDVDGDVAGKEVESRFLGGLGISFGSMGNGVTDGFIESFTGVFEFGYKMATSDKERADFVAGMKVLMSDPVAVLEKYAAEKYENWKVVLSGGGTEKQKYEVGKDIGTLVGGIVAGAGMKKVVEVVKVAKAEKAIRSAEKAQAEATKLAALAKAEARAAKLSKKARNGENFTEAGKKAVVEVNKVKNGGVIKCNQCKVKTEKPLKTKKGVKPSDTEYHIDHVKAKSKGGSGTPCNGQVLCRKCNLKKSNK
jgi:HNH endonuclease